MPIKFVHKDQDGIELAGIIISEAKLNKDEVNVPSLSLSSTTGVTNESQKIETEVKFANDPDVPFPFRGRTVSTKLAPFSPFPSVHSNEKILATTQLGPIWSVSEIEGVKHFRSGLPLPLLLIEENFSDVFNGECFLEMFVLLQFIREISAATAFQHPPLRAGFIIDDPNLHWPKYGFVNYREIAAHAKKENYHVSFATIPLDTWFTHRTTADLFRTHSRQLSLLIHGNNHAKDELVRKYTESMRKNLLNQAINRIQHMEQKADLPVCRVMVPPHGACSDNMLAELPNCGFESACISAGSLRAHNLDKPWTKTLGFFPAETIQGCPVLPRWGLTGNVKNTVLLAAYLGQPMILRGHHQDLKDGIEVLNEYAGLINDLGNVQWSNMTGLSRFNYLWRKEETTCHIKPLGRKINFDLPNEATEIIIDSPNAIENLTGQPVFTINGMHKLTPGEPFLLPAKMNRKIFIDQNTALQLSPVKEEFPATNASLILRRLLTEARDRLQALS